jgi:type IV pilus assembly protein PilE
MVAHQRSPPTRIARDPRRAWYDGRVTRPSKHERGFTLIELMIVVAMIGVLAGIAIPSWLKSSQKGKYDSEVSAMFTEIAAKEEAYKSEVGNGSYLGTPTACPTTTSQPGINFNTTCANAGNWLLLRVAATDSNIRCMYQITAGAAGTTPTPTAPFTFFTTPAGPWYWIIATCDMDGQGGTNATYFIDSIDDKQQKNNYGS